MHTHREWEKQWAKAMAHEMVIEARLSRLKSSDTKPRCGIRKHPLFGINLSILTSEIHYPFQCGLFLHDLTNARSFSSCYRNSRVVSRRVMLYGSA